MLLQVSQKEEAGMTAPHLTVTERTMVMERKVVTGRTAVTEKVVGVRTVPTAMTTGVTITVTITMTITVTMRDPNTVVWGHAAHRPAKERMPPPKNQRPRQRSHRERNPRRGLHHLNHLPREPTRGRGRRPVVNYRDSSKMGLSIPGLA